MIQVANLKAQVKVFLSGIEENISAGGRKSFEVTATKNGKKLHCGKFYFVFKEVSLQKSKDNGIARIGLRKVGGYASRVERLGIWSKISNTQRTARRLIKKLDEYFATFLGEKQELYTKGRKKVKKIKNCAGIEILTVSQPFLVSSSGENQPNYLKI